MLASVRGAGRGGRMVGIRALWMSRWIRSIALRSMFTHNAAAGTPSASNITTEDDRSVRPSLALEV
jgi:hypothetical protein